MSSLPPSDPMPEAPPKSAMKVKRLPDDWKREVVIRKNGQSAGKTDVYYYSPCGKKFRSKPQIARFLGESVDLAAFDFSRGAICGGGTSHRRARDRTVRRPMDGGKGAPALFKPLSSSPLGASGPIRRTCGVIKLPVTWVPSPKQEVKVEVVVKDEPEPMDTSDSSSVLPPPPPPPPSSSALDNSESPLPTYSNGNVDKSKPLDMTKPPHLPPPPLVPVAIPPAADEKQSTPPTASSTSTALPSSSSTNSSSSSASSSQYVFPSLWENRLRGFVVHDHETKTVIKVDLERLQNGVAHPGGSSGTNSTAFPGAVKMATSNRGGISGDMKAVSSTLQLPTNSLLNNLLGKQHVTATNNTGTAALQSSMMVGSIVPSLLAHGIKAQKQSPGGGGNYGPAANFLSAAVKSRKENSNLVKANTCSSNISQQQQNKSKVSSGNIILTLPSITQGAMKMIKQAAASSGAEIKVVSTTTMQKPTVRTSGPVKHGGGSVLSTSGTSTETNKQGGLFVSKSELVLQEERVRRLREQLLAAQGTV